MTGPNLSKKLPILVVDPKNKIAHYIENFLGIPHPKRYNHFELLRLESLQEAKEIIAKTDVPQYAAIIYESSQLKGNIKYVASIRQRDRYLPQIAFTTAKAGDDEVLWQANRAGVRYHIVNFPQLTSGNSTLMMGSARFEDLINKLFRTPSPLKRGKVVKMGGSAFDYDRPPGNPDAALIAYCNILTEFRQQKIPNPDKPHQKRFDMPAHKIICTAGAGQLGNVIKDFRAKNREVTKKISDHDEAEVIEFGLGFQDLEGMFNWWNKSMVDLYYPEHIAKAIELNLELMYTVFGLDNASLVGSGAFYFVSNGNYDKIPLMGIAPHYVMVRDEIPLQDSDTHTIALAETFGIDTVILIKRTDGIYQFDPLRGFKADPKTGRCTNVDEWREIQKTNRRLSVVTLDEMLSQKLSREGTDEHNGHADGSTGHLMEDSALEYMAQCQYVKQILVVPIAPHELFLPVAGEDFAEHVVTGERVSKKTKIYEMRRQKLEAALKGEAFSRIIRT